MNTIPLLQRTMGDDWDKLPPVIQRHYQLGKDESSCCIVHGSMRINYPAFVKPILVIARLMGALIDLKGEAMQVSVKKWITESSSALFWRRDIQAPDGRTTVFASRMEYQQANELIEFVGLGFGIRLMNTAACFVTDNKVTGMKRSGIQEYSKLRSPGFR